ncbi:hypothetical protein Tco_0775875 [Tanacetum coccineum]
MWCQRMPQQMRCRSVSDAVLHFADVAALFENGTTAPSTLMRHCLGQVRFMDFEAMLGSVRFKLACLSANLAW